MLDTLLLRPSLHFTALHPTTLHYPLIWLNPIIYPITPFHLTSLHFTSPHFTSLHCTSVDCKILQDWREEDERMNLCVVIFYDNHLLLGLVILKMNLRESAKSVA